MDEETVQLNLAMIGTAIQRLLGAAAITPEQLQAEINDMIDPYYDEFPPLDDSDATSHP